MGGYLASSIQGSAQHPTENQTRHSAHSHPPFRGVGGEAGVGNPSNANVTCHQCFASKKHPTMRNFKSKLDVEQRDCSCFFVGGVLFMGGPIPLARTGTCRGRRPRRRRGGYRGRAAGGGGRTLGADPHPPPAPPPPLPGVAVGGLRGGEGGGYSPPMLDFGTFQRVNSSRS